MKQLEQLRIGGPPLASQLPYFDFDERDSLFLIDLLDDLGKP